jgi:hypothetical protein
MELFELRRSYVLMPKESVDTCMMDANSDGRSDEDSKLATLGYLKALGGL